MMSTTDLWGEEVNHATLLEDSPPSMLRNCLAEINILLWEESKLAYALDKAARSGVAEELALAFRGLEEKGEERMTLLEALTKEVKHALQKAELRLGTGRPS